MKKTVLSRSKRLIIEDDADHLNNFEPSDSEDEYAENEKLLLEATRKGKGRDERESEEEVFCLHSSGDDSDAQENLESDLDRGDDDDLPNIKAWGKKRKNFYNTDYVDQDYGGFQGGDAEAAKLEEQEALAIQQRLVEQLDEGDFSLDIFAKDFFPKEKEKDKEVIKIDLTKLSKREQLSLLQKESPEFLELVEDYKAKLTEVIDKLQPILVLVKTGSIPASPASEFIKTKYHLILNYCTNIAFYLLLKAKHISIQSHPIVRRLFQYRQLLKQLEPIDEKVMKPQIDTILEIIEGGEELHMTARIGNSNDVLKLPKRKHLSVASESKEDSSDTDVESPPKRKIKEKSKKDKVAESMMKDNFINDIVVEGNDLTSHTAQEQMTEIMEGKRAITYQMAKNKGLIPRRKKEQRNPRVKHKKKFLKAKIRRKGQIREPRKEIKKYGGEISGIKIGVSKSIKLK